MNISGILLSTWSIHIPINLKYSYLFSDRQNTFLIYLFIYLFIYLYKIFLMFDLPYLHYLTV